MTTRALELARTFGYRTAVLGAEDDAARRLYERMGFRAVCTVDEYVFEP
jgi:predicted GNAT family acetyltransferase